MGQECPTCTPNRYCRQKRKNHFIQKNREKTASEQKPPDQEKQTVQHLFLRSLGGKPPRQEQKLPPASVRTTSPSQRQGAALRAVPTASSAIPHPDPNPTPSQRSLPCPTCNLPQHACPVPSTALPIPTLSCNHPVPHSPQSCPTLALPHLTSGANAEVKPPLNFKNSCVRANNQ